MTDPTASRPQPGPGSQQNSFKLMQTVLESQAAVNKATEQAMVEINIAMKSMNQGFDGMFGEQTYGPGANGGRPTFSGNGVRRPTYSPYDSGGSQYGHGLSGIRSAVASKIHSQYGRGSGSKFETYRDRDNNLRYRETTPDGSVDYKDLGWENTQDGSSALAGASRQGMISNFAEGYAARGLLGGAKALPYVGAAVVGAEAVHEGLTMVANQRAANAPYQAIYGGSNFDQFGQRLSQFGYGLSNLFGGGMTWGQSQQAFQGVSALGYQGNQRSQDLNFISQNYMKMGTSVSDSLKLITTASQDLNQSLTGLQQGLQSTRDAAIATGQSGNVGTQMYSQNYQQLTQTYADPVGGVAQLNGVLSPIQASLGRYMSGVSLTSMLSDPAQAQMMASRMGMTYTQFVGAVQSGSPSVLKAVDQNLAMAAAPTLQNQAVSNFINKRVSGLELAKGGRISPDDMASLANQLLRSHTGLNIQGLIASYAAHGMSGLTPEQAAIMMISQAKGQLLNKKTLADYHVVAPKPYLAQTTVARMTGEPGKTVITSLNATTANPVLADAQKKLAGKNIEVSGPAGEKRVVSIAEALKSYPDQIAKGTAVVMGENGMTVRQALGGEHQNSFLYNSQIEKYYDMNAAEKTHVSGGINHSTYSNTHIGSAVANSKGLNQRYGETVPAYNQAIAKHNANVVQKAGGRVVIEPSPALRELLSFHSSGNVQVSNYSAQSGYPVAPTGPGE